jgi:hypothetical protein
VNEIVLEQDVAHVIAIVYGEIEIVKILNRDNGTGSSMQFS